MSAGDDQPQFADTLENRDDPRSSDIVLAALTDAAREFERWRNEVDRIDRVYSLSRSLADNISYRDPDFDLFWASVEIIKPAIYARPPQPVVGTRFSIRDAFLDQASEMLERVICTALQKTCIDQVMIGLRDDLILTGRGVPWVTLDESGDGKCVMIEHLDNSDFLHEPARKWSDVGWVARCAWMTKEAMRERFSRTSGDAYQDAGFLRRRDTERHGMTDGSEKAPVWEVWSRTDGRVYWVSPGVDVMLDDDVPHLDLDGFYPCPRPAYGTLKRRTLIPVPDYLRYETHLNQINDLTARIYGLLDQIRVKGIIPTGSDIGDAVEAAMRENEDDTFLIPVPAAGLTQQGGQLIQFLPLDMFAQTVQGLIQSRAQLINDFYELSGISDIMRGASDAQETLGAQRLKSQYGSVRVRDKIDELQRVARDCCAIAGEIIAENFSGTQIMEMSMIHLPSDTDIKKQISDVQEQARRAMQQIEFQAHEIEARARVAQSLAPAMPPPQPAAAPGGIGQ